MKALQMSNRWIPSIFWVTVGSQPWGCSRARDNFWTLRPLPARLLAPSLINFWGNPGFWALYQAIRIPTQRGFGAATTPMLTKTRCCTGSCSRTARTPQGLALGQIWFPNSLCTRDWRSMCSWRSSLMKADLWRMVFVTCTDFDLKV